MCDVSLEVNEDLDEPVYVYYEIKGFYQNHFNYVKSRDNPQLRGESRTSKDVATCSPIKENSDLYTDLSFTGATLDRTDVANPCGLAAYTLFNGT
jgi:hypothetical protein